MDDDERSRLSTEISKARSQRSLDQPTPASSRTTKVRTRSRTSLDRRPLPSPTSHHPRRATLPSSSLKEAPHSHETEVADSPPLSFHPSSGIPDTLHRDHANKPMPGIDRKPLPYHPLSHLGAGRFYDPGADRKRRHHRLRERASWSKLISKESSPSWPPQTTRDLLKEAGEWLDLVYPCPAPLEDGEVGSLQSPSSSGSFETLRGNEVNDRVWTHGGGAVSLIPLVDEGKDSLRSASCRDHGDMDISKDDCDLGGDDTDKEFVSLSRKISRLRGEKILVHSQPLLPSSYPARPPTGKKVKKPIPHNDGRASKVREQLVMLQGLNSAGGIGGGSGVRNHEDHCLPNLAELDATPAAPREDVLTEAPISPTRPFSDCNKNTSDYDEEEDSMSGRSPNERTTPQGRPEYINLPIDLGDEQLSAAIAEALGFDRSPAGEELIGNDEIADDTFPGDIRDVQAPVDSCDGGETPSTTLAFNTVSVDDFLPPQSSSTREPDTHEPILDPPDIQISRPASPFQESSSSPGITLSKSQPKPVYGAASNENRVMDEIAIASPSSPKSEKNETIVGIFSDLENLALASERFTLTT